MIVRAFYRAILKRDELVSAGLIPNTKELIMDIILGLIILFAVGSCTLKEACKPDDVAGTFKFCSKIFDKK